MGNIYVTDGHSIRKIDATTGAVTTFAGSTSPGSSDNSDPLLASFNSPLSITVDSQDNLYVGDYANNKIRRIDKQTSAVTSYAGTGLEGSEDNNDGQLASFNFPTAIYADNKDNLWVADWLNNKVRKVEPSATLVGQPSNDAVGNNDVCMVVSDGNSDVEQCFTIEVINVNDRPTISATIINSVVEDSLYQLQATGSDIDIDVGIDDVLSYDIINKPTWAEFDTSTGLLSGTPSNSDVGVTEGIVISVSDQAQLSASLDPFDLTVVNTNDAPIISGSPITAIDEGSPYLVVLNATDVDIGDRLTFTITNAPSWLTLDSQNGVLQGTPSRDDVGISENIILSVTDGIATTSLSPFNLEVLLVNDPPTLVANQSLEGPEDSVLTASILANDAQSDPLTFELAEPATHGQISITGDIVSYTPNTNFYGSDSFALVAFDGFAYSQPQSFSVTVTPQDDPELAINDLIYLPTEAPEGGYVLDVLANDNIGVQIAGAFALKGKVIVEDGHLRLLPLSEQLPALTITYAVQDDLSNYAPAQVVVVFE